MGVKKIKGGRRDLVLDRVEFDVDRERVVSVEGHVSPVSDGEGDIFEELGMRRID